MTKMFRLNRSIIYWWSSSFVIIVIFHSSLALQSESDGLQAVLIERYNDHRNEDGYWKSAEVRPDASTVELITANGYPVETHDIVTADNYILTVHRIPYGRNSKNNKTNSDKPPVYLLHGILQSSADWVLNSKVDNCLGFVLADAGYDVWMGNVRGNTYSNKHVYLTNNQVAYWNYSLEELGKYDVTVVIDYILENTNKPKLHFIGYSLGNIHFFLAAAIYPEEINKKVALHISYAPAIYFGEMPAVGHFVSSFSPLFQIIQDITGGLPTVPHGLHTLITAFLPIICNPKLDLIGICRFALFLFTGFGPNQITKEQIPAIMGHLFTPISLKVIIHGMQLTNHGDFKHFDYGSKGNILEYGQVDAPTYDIRRITTPVVLIRAPRDVYFNRKTFDRIARNITNLVESSEVSDPEFTHLDFCYGQSANSLVYNHTVELLHRFS